MMLIEEIMPFAEKRSLIKLFDMRVKNKIKRIITNKAIKIDNDFFMEFIA